MGGGETTQVYQPSPLEEQQAHLLGSVMPYLQNYMKSGMTGIPTSQQQGAFTQASMGLREQAGRMGIAPGDPRMFESLTKLSESLTKPDMSAVNLAAQLFGKGAPEAGTTTSTTTPGGMQSAATIAQIVAALAMAYGAAGSSIEFKEDISIVDEEKLNQLLTEIEQFDIVNFRYKGEQINIPHIGILAEEAPDVIKWRLDNRFIDITDCIGYLFATVKALSKKIKELENKDASR